MPLDPLIEEILAPLQESWKRTDRLMDELEAQLSLLQEQLDALIKESRE